MSGSKSWFGFCVVKPHQRNAPKRRVYRKRDEFLRELIQVEEKYKNSQNESLKPRMQELRNKVNKLNEKIALEFARGANFLPR